MDTTPTTWTILDAAHTALRDAVTGVRTDQWDGPTPCSGWTVTQVLQHAAGDQQAYAAVLGEGDFPAYDPFSPSGTVETSALELLDPPLTASRHAFSRVGADDAAVAVPLPQARLAAPVAVGAAALDAAVHAWDIAVATGQHSPMDAALAEQLYAVAVEIVEPLRGFAYAAALPGDDGDAVDRLLRYLGRDPRWSPTA
ncbi:TIGR03086 family metal-binding protein [Terracoccus sp. 273MFTsu3.1]|uniref:TIGR03086 family metal-binding protein n=1 Tax=Terracoccus sp. 273MFTsu3.1 TaxID=1172188 RepID=UPI00036D89E8|nr:TIGR03086 family metal-binding protein [Terracoccus sp. 273MFTsu3.1]